MISQCGFTIFYHYWQQLLRPSLFTRYSNNLKNILFILLLSLTISCAHKSSAPIIQREFKVDTVYQRLIDKVFQPIDKIIYSDCNDTAYLMTIQALNRKLDSAKTTREATVITNKLRQVLEDRNDREIKELKISLKSANAAYSLRETQVKELTDQLAAMEKTRRVDIRQQSSSCSWWHIPAILALLALLFFAVLMKVKSPL